MLHTKKKSQKATLTRLALPRLYALTTVEQKFKGAHAQDKARYV